MKTMRFFILAAAALGAATTTFASPISGPAAGVSVEFIRPDEFTDFKMSQWGTADEHAVLSRQLTDAVKRDAARHLPAGYSLMLRIHDVDLAGDINLFHGPRLNDVRFVRDIYPPRIELEYSLADANGQVVDSGSRTLTDLAFDLRFTMPNSDYTVREQEMLRDFLRELGHSIARG